MGARTGRLLNGSQQTMVRTIVKLVATWSLRPWAVGSRGELKAAAMHEYARSVARASPGCEVLPPPALALRPFDANRARLAKETHHVDITPHLFILEAACYSEPRLLELRALASRGDETWRRPLSPPLTGSNHPPSPRPHSAKDGL